MVPTNYKKWNSGYSYIMRKLPQPVIRNFPPVRVYLDDVKRLYDILKEKCKKVRIQTDRFEVDDPQLLKEIETDQIRTLILQGTEPNVMISLLPDRANAFIDEESTLNLGIMSEIEEILKRCYRKVARLFTNAIYYMVIFLAIFIATTYLIIRFADGLVENALLILLVILLGCLFYWQDGLSRRQYSTIILQERWGTKSFLFRNKDLILVGVITAIITAALTVILTIWFT